MTAMTDRGVYAPETLACIDLGPYVLTAKWEFHASKLQESHVASAPYIRATPFRKNFSERYPISEFTRLWRLVRLATWTTAAKVTRYFSREGIY